MGGNGIGLSEILVLAVIIVIFIRPADMPKIVRYIGKMWAKFYLYFSIFKREIRKIETEIGIEEEMKEIRAINAQLKGEVVSLRNSVNVIEKNEINEIKNKAESSLNIDNK
jgi:Sec-independent protein translocase protein TatA